MSPAVVRETVAVAGVDVHIEGDGAETIVMVHGWPDTYRLWDTQVGHFASRYRCVRFTLPGFRASDARHAYTLEEITDLLRRIVERTCADGKAILLLHDWGCAFGYAFAMRHPERVSRIVGIDIGDPDSLQRSMPLKARLIAWAYQNWLAWSWIAGGAVGDWMNRSAARLLGARATPADQISSNMAYPYYLLWYGGERSYRRHGQAFDPACPMLFAYGRRKPLMFHAQAWADALAKRHGSAVVEFDAGHWLMTTQSERFNRVVGDWLAGGSGE